jgi:16S rRNA processing protein RimM
MNFLAVGIVRTSHGIHGAMKVRSFSGEYGHFKRFKEIQLKHGDNRKSLTINRIRFGHAMAMVECAGIDTPEEAKKYIGWEILVPREMCAPLLHDEYYIADLVGCILFLEKESVGRIISVIDGGGNSLLETELEDKRKVLIPFQKEYIGEVNIGEKKIELLKGWLLG